MGFEILGTDHLGASAPAIAQTVVYRHPCDCASASRPLAGGEHAEHRFDVDGEPFPWYLTVEGPSFSKSGDLYLVHVPIIPALVLQLSAAPAWSFEHGRGSQPVIAGKRFPWYIDETGVTYRCALREAPVVELSFLARHVDADCDIEDLGTGQRHTMGGEVTQTAPDGVS